MNMGGLVARALNLRSRDCRFDSWSVHCQITALGKLFTSI